ncbi:MAG: VWA domain-containing protein [Rhodothermales bacterium]|nr:VWA domain-containing protein [Rhodothermales bacterium]MBO6780039.1 VWA domain-containing protein [Rhodothermales bacterium]
MKTILRPLSAGLLAGILFIGCAAPRSAQEAAPEEEPEATVEVPVPEANAPDEREDIATGLQLDEIVVNYERAVKAGHAMAIQATQQIARPPLRAGWDPDFSTEDYTRIRENGFLNVTDDPLSTFSIDVDAASYSNVRRFIRDGIAPPRDAVRIEEMINYFSYDYPNPEAGKPFSTVMEVGPAPWNAEHQLLHVGLKGAPIDLVGRPASNLVFLLDVSGSMNQQSKLPLLKKAFRMLTAELGENDRVSIVVYAGAAGMVLPPTSGDNAETILKALDQLQAGGSTAGAAGIQLAYDTARRNHIAGGINRVILATDGDFNVGVSSDAELVRLIEDRRRQGTYLTVLGFGTGNLKDNKMEQLADHGNGNYYYIDSELEARKVLVSELGGTLHTIAKDVKLQIEFNPAHIQAYRLIGYENRLLADADFNDDTKDAGELGAGHTVTALYELVPVGVESSAARAVDELRYQAPGRTLAATSGELLTLKLRYKAPDSESSERIVHALQEPDRGTAVTADFAFSAAVAAFGMILRDSEYKGAASLEQVRRLARMGKGQDHRGYRSDFLALVDDYDRLAQTASR